MPWKQLPGRRGVIAIDTNIVVRLLTKDDLRLYEASRKLIASDNVYIPDSVILETEWVLRYAYDFEPAQICYALRRLFGLPNVSLSNQFLIAQVLSWHEQGLDFADAFHLANSHSLAALKTFDLSFIKKSKGLSTCDVQKP
jgi:predicted nucleic-acid-binding protein